MVLSNSQYLRIGWSYDHETLPKFAQLNYIESHKIPVAWRQLEKNAEKNKFGGVNLPPPPPEIGLNNFPKLGENFFPLSRKLMGHQCPSGRQRKM